jgi:hypothetical protein
MLPPEGNQGIQLPERQGQWTMRRLFHLRQQLSLLPG